MNTKILEQLTFGFEIEGSFKEGMDEKLGWLGTWKTDGSVHNVMSKGEPQRTLYDHRNYCVDCVVEEIPSGIYRMVTACEEHARYVEETRLARSQSSEYASKIYQNFDEMLADLERFKSNSVRGATHFFNDTCGLHLHIGMKQSKTKKKFKVPDYQADGSTIMRTRVREVVSDNHKKLWQTVQSWELQKQLHAEALTYCDCQNDRLTKPRSDGRDGDNFCKVYKNSRSMIEATKGNSIKYSFMNFHYYKTLEFRFLTPCEHKVANVKKLLESLTMFLGKEAKDNYIRHVNMEKLEPKTQVFNRVVQETNKKLDIKMPLFTYVPYIQVRIVDKDKWEGRIIKNSMYKTVPITKKWELDLIKKAFNELGQTVNAGYWVAANRLGLTKESFVGGSNWQLEEPFSYGDTARGIATANILRERITPPNSSF